MKNGIKQKSKNGWVALLKEFMKGLDREKGQLMKNRKKGERRMKEEEKMETT